MSDYFVHESSYIDDNVSIGSGTKVWHFCHVQDSAIIGENCTLGQNVNIAKGVQIGNNVKIQNNVSVYEGVTLEDYVFCGPSMVFTNDFNPRSRYRHKPYERTLIRTGASIGANATVLCGIVIGENAMVAAGAVVLHDIPAHSLVAGVPARQTGWVCECGQKLTTAYVCPVCGKKYRLAQDGLCEKE